MRIPSLFFFCLAGLAPSARAAPSLVPVQGYLTTADGVVVEGPVSITFALYTTADDADPVWLETQAVTVDSGVFTAYLGSFAALPADFFKTHDELWLGVSVGGDFEMDRVRLGLVPYAGFAAFGAGVDPEPPAKPQVAVAQTCPPGQMVTGIDGAGKLLCASPPTGGNSGGIEGIGTTNRLAKFSKSDTLTSSIVTESSSKIGINDTSPSRTLDVKGDLQVTGDFYWGGKNFSTSSCIVMGGTSCSSACGAHGMSCYKAMAIDKDSTSTSCSQSGYKFCCCRN